MKALAVCPARTHVDHRLMAALTAARLPLLPLFEHSDLPRARSLLLSMALETPAERVILVDSDVVPTEAQLRELAGSPLVTAEMALTGIYPTREGLSWCVHAPTVTAETAFVAEWSGLGFCAIHRQSLERLAALLPPVTGDVRPWTPFCLPRQHDDGAYMADDRALWWRLAQVGVGLTATRSLTVGHVASMVLTSPKERT